MEMQAFLFRAKCSLCTSASSLPVSLLVSHTSRHLAKLHTEKNFKAFCVWRHIHSLSIVRVCVSTHHHGFASTWLYKNSGVGMTFVVVLFSVSWVLVVRLCLNAHCTTALHQPLRQHTSFRVHKKVLLEVTHKRDAKIALLICSQCVRVCTSGSLLPLSTQSWFPHWNLQLHLLSTNCKHTFFLQC